MNRIRFFMFLCKALPSERESEYKYKGIMLNRCKWIWTLTQTQQRLNSMLNIKNIDVERLSTTLNMNYWRERVESHFKRWYWLFTVNGICVRLCPMSECISIWGRLIKRIRRSMAWRKRKKHHLKTTSRLLTLQPSCNLTFSRLNALQVQPTSMAMPIR